MRQFIPAKELAAMLNMTPEGLWLRAQREAWPWQFARVGRGRPTREYRIAELPTEIRSRVLAEALKSLPAPAAASAPSAAVIPLPGAAAARRPPASAAGVLSPAAAPALPAAPDPRSLKEYQQQAAMARMTILKRIGELRSTLELSLDLAIEALNKSVLADPDQVLARLLARANARPRGGRVALLTKATYYRWLQLEQEGGYGRLAPQPTHHVRLPDWAFTLLRLYQRPTKPSLSDCLRQLPTALAEDGVACEPPSYAAARRFVTQQVGSVALQVGRMGPRELRSKLPFVRRSFADLKPGDIYTADGHKFKAQVQHPDRPGAFRPEITPVLDVATRKCVGFSISLDENQYDVLAALKHAFVTHGVCAIWYVDKGPGFDNLLQKDTLVGMAARLGYRVEHSIPYNSQARGVIERFHGSVLIPLARRLDSGIAPGTDRQHLQKVHKLVTKAQRQHGVRTALPTFDEFVALLAQAIDDYNNREHRSLAREGVKCTPAQRWQQEIEAGWQVQPLGQDIERDLFWPQTICLVRRGEVRFRGKTYFSAGLTEYDGEKVLVAFDIHDPSLVVVRDQSRRWICEAQLDGNVRPYYPLSVVAERRIERAEAQLRRVDNKAQRIREELERAQALPHAPSPTASFIDITPAEPLPVENARPLFEGEADRYEWLMAHRDAWRENDRPWVERFVQTELYALLAERWEMLGITWRGDGAPASFKAAD